MLLSSTQIIINILLIFLIILYIFSVAVITRIYSVVTLILSYIIVSIIAILYLQSFIAVVLLMVYAGAISIFFIFMVMLLNLQKRGTGAVKLTFGSFILFFVLFISLAQLISDNFFFLISSLDLDRDDVGGEFLQNFYGHETNITGEFSVGGLSKSPDVVVGIDNGSQLIRIGFALYTVYVYGFLGAGLLLLIAIVGVTSLFNCTPRLQKSRESDSIQILRGLKSK